jgi:hypothetical protein
MCSNHLNIEEKPLGHVCVAYVKGVSEKFEHIWNQYNISTILEMKPILCGFLSPENGVSLGCGWRDGLQLWRAAAIDKRHGVVLKLGG